MKLSVLSGSKGSLCIVSYFSVLRLILLAISISIKYQENVINQQTNSVGPRPPLEPDRTLNQTENSPTVTEPESSLPC